MRVEFRKEAKVTLLPGCMHERGRSISFEKGCASVGGVCVVPSVAHSVWKGGGGEGGDRAIPPPEVVPLERQAAQVGAV